MSTSDTAAGPLPATGPGPATPVFGSHPGGSRAAVPTAPVRRRDAARFVWSELALVLGRRRNLILLAALACAPIALGIAVRLSNSSGGNGPSFIGQITENGLFLVFASLTVTLPVFLPLAVAVAAGDAVAGEAASGTLRNLLVVPVSRTALLVVKYIGVVVYAAAGVLAVAGTALVVGLILFPHGEVTLLSGTTVSFTDALGRAGLVALYVLAMLAGVGAVGLFVSTLTEVPIAAMSAVLVLTIVSEIADQIPQIAVIHPYLFSHPWLSFGDLLRQPMAFTNVGVGLLTQAAYIAIFGSLAWARLRTRDITG